MAVSQQDIALTLQQTYFYRKEPPASLPPATKPSAVEMVFWILSRRRNLVLLYWLLAS